MWRHARVPVCVCVRPFWESHMERIKKLQHCYTRKCYHYKVDNGVKGAKGLCLRFRLRLWVQVGAEKELPKMLQNEDVGKCEDVHIILIY